MAHKPAQLSPHAEVIGTCLSNFAATSFQFHQRWWKTAEHAFQWCKTTDKIWADRIANSKTPAEAKKWGNLAPLRPDWEDIKEAVMLEVLRSKHRDDRIARDFLLATEDLPIVESAKYDNYWGTGAKGTGRNRLGKLLELVRSELRETFG